ncbi:type II secretion system protein [Roseateles toxinivorans]|uniref:MSHA pilin protein MshA n=1 Tax=Roseateles toxinivorans TaxID=270368 RepID=A0A4R6QUT9_9BURK|nr:prepilin-type N-terminal cleavage/methylation domain-containing protein [Roseateles toxinivorans]TDP74979.1 MSHA pilin protein MshA [Roseateles toxinivorans]
MNAKQAGFTLIELVMVIVILGVLSAVALPKFVDIKSDAQQASIDGVAGALNSAASVNYAARKANATKGVEIKTCGDVKNALTGGIPATMEITVPGTVVAADATVTTCEVRLIATPAIKQSFTAIGIL